MADFLTPGERSERMSRIRSGDTGPERTLRRVLHKHGLRFRLHDNALPGKPDVVLKRHRAVVFVHGCFWHRHAGCTIATTPKSNTDFWVEKFERNVKRDRKTKRALRLLGWRVFVVWECQLSSARRAERVGERLSRLMSLTRPAK